MLPESPVAFLDPISRLPERLYVTEVRGPVINALLASTGEALVFAGRDKSLDQFRHDLEIDWGIVTVHDRSALKRDIELFEAYFEGDRPPFETVVQPFRVTPFTLAVHKAIARIPFGTTISYGELAAEVDRPLASRAAGGACGKNRILIAIPCHRVVASNGIGGFGSGLPVKKRLLDFEEVDWRALGKSRAPKRLASVTPRHSGQRHNNGAQ